MLGVQDQRGMHGAHPQLARRFAVQQMQEMRGDRIVVGVHFDAPAAVTEVVPVAQHRRQARQYPIRQLTRRRGRMLRMLRLETAEHRHAAAQHIHRVTRARQQLERAAQRRRQIAPCLEPPLVGRQFARIGKFLVNQQVSDLLVLRSLGDVEDVEAAVMQVVAGQPDSGQRGVARHHARQRYRFLGHFSAPCRRQTAGPDAVRRPRSPDTCTDPRVSACARSYCAACRRGEWPR